MNKLVELLRKNARLTNNELAVMLGKKPEEIDPSVSGRVPVVISHDNRYFQDKWQGMPKDGFTKLFERLLDHEGITVKTGVDAGSFIKIEDNLK